MISTKTINHIELRNVINNISAQFVYRKFEPHEQIDEQLSNQWRYS